MDRGAWQAVVHGSQKSKTKISYNDSKNNDNRFPWVDQEQIMTSHKKETKYIINLYFQQRSSWTTWLPIYRVQYHKLMILVTQKNHELAQKNT